MKIKRALLSVYDKTGIVDFARTLVDEFGIEILSTGGTAKLLNKSDIPVTLVEDITGWGEMLDGRVKTLHPKIHAAILADRDNPAHMRQLEDADIKPIDMVVVNLYPFEETVADPDCKFEDAIEMIDIGGPCMLRAAAKNHKHVLACMGNYGDVIEYLRTGDAAASMEVREALAVFMATSSYDGEVHAWLWREGPRDHFEVNQLRLLDPEALRYGENPHQSARIFTHEGDPQFARLRCSVGQSTAKISYNNYVDADAALTLCSDVSRGHDSKSVCVFIKHTNACGVGVASDPVEAYRKAYLGDPNAAMGGILACNFTVTVEFAESVMNSLATWGRDAGAGAFFIEVWIAPDFTNDDVVSTIHTAKKWGERVRLLDVSYAFDVEPDPPFLDFKQITGEVLIQTPDTLGLNENQWHVVTKREPSVQEMSDLRLAWLVCKHTKSNAISICKNGMLIGNGAGQMSRVMSCRIATWLAQDNGHTQKLPGSVAASDAFFPFRDGPDLLIKAGVTAIIQPGGSKRDAETIAACNERDIAMIVTGTRHFKH